MKSTHLAIFTLAATAPLHAFTTLSSTDAFVVTPASGPGNLIVSGDLTTLKGLDIGVSTVPTKSAIQLDWYNTTPLPKTATFDLTDATSTFLWRDNLTATARNKMKLDGANLLSLYNAAGTATPITLNGANGRITLSGNGSGLYSGNQPVLTLNAAGQPAFGANQPLAISNTTASTTPTTGALTLAGGLGVTGSINTTADAYFNGVRVGRGGGNNPQNTALGAGALSATGTGTANTAIGAGALAANVSSAGYNTAVGFEALKNNTVGHGNNAFGLHSLYSNTTGHNNIAMGVGALFLNPTGAWNVAIGNEALRNIATGNGNVALGQDAGKLQADGATLTNATNSTYIGFVARGFNSSDNNSIVIGANAVGKGANTTVIGTPATTQTHLFGKTITPGLEVGGSSHLGATAENLLNLPAGVTGSYYGPQITGSNYFQHDFLFTKTGDETTSDFTVPLGIFINIGGEMTVDISTPSSDPDSGSAHYVLNGKRHWEEGALVASEYRAFGGAANIELYGRNLHGFIILYVKFDAKTRSPGEVYEHSMQVKVSGLGFGAVPQLRDYPFSFVYPITKVDSTTRPNYGTVTKTITAPQITLDGAVNTTGTLTSAGSPVLTQASVGAIGYQTAPQVDAVITAKGYQTAAQISSNGYQTAPQVEAAITSKGYLDASALSAELTSRNLLNASNLASALTSAPQVELQTVTIQGNTVLNGNVTLAQPQGDISMGIFE